MRHLYSEGQSIRPGLPWKLSKQRIRLQSRIKTQDLIPGLGRCSEEGNGYPLSILAWEIPWTEEAGGLQSMRSRKTWTVGLSMCVHACTHVHTHTHTHTDTVSGQEPCSNGSSFMGKQNQGKRSFHLPTHKRVPFPSRIFTSKIAIHNRGSRNYYRERTSLEVRSFFQTTSSI